VSSNADWFLRLVWQASIFLAVTSVFIAFGLVLNRWLEQRAAVRTAARQSELSRLVHALLASPREPDQHSLPPLQNGDEPIVLGIVLDIVRVTRGHDAARMIALVELWNLRPYLKSWLEGRVRNRMVRALTLYSHFRDPESLDILLNHIEHPAIYVQLTALRGVAERGVAANLALVIKALSKTQETNVPLLSDILRRFGVEAVPELTDLAQGTAIPPIRLAAVQALGNIGSLDAFGPLRDLSRDPLVGVRVAALEALARLGDPRAENAILRALIDDEPRVRAAAARTAGFLGLREVLPSLADALNDEFWEVRFRAAEALYALGTPGILALRSIATDRFLNVPDPVSLGDSEHGYDPANPGPEMAASMLAEKEGVDA
jgi:HEAT repeat protein